MVPYVAIYRLLMRMAQAQYTMNDVVFYVAIALLSLILQILCHTFSTTISHKTAFSILEQMQVAVTEKIMRMPLGYTQNKGSGYFKDMIIDQIERLEYPLAHALPETTSGYFCPSPLSYSCFLWTGVWRLPPALPAAVTLLFYLPMYIGIMNELPIPIIARCLP